MLYNSAMISLCRKRYSELRGSYECDCGRTHKFHTAALLEHGAFKRLAAFLSDFTPPLSRIVLFYDDESLMNTVFNYIKKDFRVMCVRTETDKKKLELTALPEDAKLVLAVGSADAVNAAKYRACIDDLPVVIAALPDFSAFGPRCLVRENGLPSTYVVNRPVGYIFDLDVELSGNDKAAVFGTVAARLNTSLDYYAAALLEGGEFCPYLCGEIGDIAAKTVFEVEKDGLSSVALKEILLEAALKLSLIAGMGDFDRGSEVQCAFTFAALEDCKYSQGELQFLFSSLLARLFRAHTVRRKSFVAPPDNNLRLTQIAKLFGVTEMQALRSVRRQLSGKEAALIEYRLKEYSTELLEKINKNINLFRIAFRTFKRMYDDDGYSLYDLAGADLSLSIALAPDVVRGRGLLTALKRLGDLDKYII